MKLCLSTSTDLNSLALIQKNELLIEKKWWRKQAPSDALVHEIDKVLRKVRKSPNDIDGVLVDIGPGSFTGLRVGLNIAQTFAFDRDLPIWPVSSLELLAQSAAPASFQGTLITLLDAHRQLFYFQAHYQTKADIQSLGQPEALSLEDAVAASMTTSASHGPALRLRLAGDVLAEGHRLKSAVSSAFARLSPSASKARVAHFPRARYLAQFSCRKPIHWRDVEPLYVRIPQVLERH